MSTGNKSIVRTLSLGEGEEEMLLKPLTALKAV
jgi:hypothetical protein